MDYRKAEEKNIRRFETLCSDAVEVQNRLLAEILCRNSQTEYGRTRHFSNLHTVEDYQKTVPVTEYGDYEELIKRQIRGRTESDHQRTCRVLLHQFRQYIAAEIYSRYETGRGHP